MTDYYSEDRNRRLAEKMLEQQGQINKLRAELAVADAEQAGLRATVLREAIDVAREEGHRLEEVAGIESARGARSVAYLLRRLLVKAQTTTPDAAAESVDGGPICTAVAARAAGLDIPPAPAELSAMAETIVAAAQGAPTPEADLARAVPLTLEALAAAQRERDNARAQLADATAELTRSENARDALRDRVEGERRRGDHAEQRAARVLRAEADLDTANYRLDRIRDAARLHRLQLIGTRELYAVIDAAEEPDEQAAPADWRHITDTVARAQIVVDHWRHALFQENAAAAHALAMVASALNGATDPSDCGLPEHLHHAYRTAGTTTKGNT